MEQANLLMNEEDVRNKIVTLWLADHGFGPSDILLEPAFELSLGRHVLRVGQGQRPKSQTTLGTFRPRADILVRSKDGRNLMIVEVKAPSEPLDTDAREQGISYARLLREGGIAPFVVLTNGKQTQIYDTLSGDLLDHTSIPLSHPHARSGFRVSGADLALRAEALQSFISLSSDNLIEFCWLQVSHHTRMLRSDDLQSGKKYIPSLYIDRVKAQERLTDLVDREQRGVVLLLGQPQVGKTNFICRAAEERLRQGLPCLVYPAIGMDRGLLEEISEDFQWTLSDASAPFHAVDKIRRALEKASARMVIFIDGWNEANLSVARAIDRQCSRLSCDAIQFVISMTHLAASRLLMDAAGNPSYLSEAAAVTASGIPLIEVSPERCDEKWSTVYLHRYTSEEVSEVYERYASLYGVVVPDEHVPYDDPFLIRVAMEACQGHTLPISLDEPELINSSIAKKAARVVDTHRDQVHAFLREAAGEMFVGDAPLQHSLAMRCWGLAPTSPTPDGLFEAALLARVHNERGLPAIDFYFGRERDYVVAYWVRDWPNRLQGDAEAIALEIGMAVQTAVGADALRWFLRQPQHIAILFAAAEAMPIIRASSARRIIMSSLWQAALTTDIVEDGRMAAIIQQAARDEDMLVRAEAAKMLAILSEDYNELTEILSVDRGLIVGLLGIEEQYPLGNDSVGTVVLDALRKLHWDMYPQQGQETSELTELLEEVLDHDSPAIREAASKAIAYLAPERFLSLLSARYAYLKAHPDIQENYLGGLIIAANELDERYYGSMCPGYLDVLKEDMEKQSSLMDEYTRMCGVVSPIISLYSTYDIAKRLNDLLQDLKPSDEWLDANHLRVASLNCNASIGQIELQF